MYPVLFKIGGLNFYSHGMLIVAGIIFAALLIFFLSKRSELNQSYLLDNIIYVSLFGMIGARIAYFILYPNQWSNLSQIFLLWQGGLVSFGGFILGAITLLILLKSQKQSVLPWLDLFAIGLPLGIAFARVGDWLAGDYGILSAAVINGFWAKFVNNPLLEAVLCVLILIILLSIFLFAKKKVSDGFIFLLSILIYTGGRFIIDFWRSDPDFFVGLSVGQTFSLIVFIIIGLLFIIMARKGRKGVYNANV